jgi:hypothetical protein
MILILEEHNGLAFFTIYNNPMSNKEAHEYLALQCQEELVKLKHWLQPLPFLFANAIPLMHNMSNSLDTNNVKFENSNLILASMTIESPPSTSLCVNYACRKFKGALQDFESLLIYNFHSFPHELFLNF